MALAAGISGSGRGDHAGAAAAGWQVMAALLEAVAGPLAGEDQGAALVSGMRLVAIGGMCLDLPATPENGAEFGYPGSESGPGPFPQIRVLGIGECGTRAVLGAATSPLATGEQALARQLLAKLAPGDLLAAGRNFLSHGLLKEVLEAGVHVLWRAKSDVDLPVLEVLPDGTWLSRIAGPAASRRMRRKGASAASAALAAFPPHGLDDAVADLAFEITCTRNLVPERPGRRYARETKRAGGRYKTRKHGQSSRLTPLTTVRFWLLPVPP